MSSTIIAVRTRRRGTVLRSVGAVAAGFLVNAVGGSVVDAILHGTGIFPPTGEPMAAGLWLLAIGYRVLFGLAGCYLTARLAPADPLRHALALGAIGLLLSIGGTIAMWDQGPAWYALAVVASVLPCAVVGGRFGARRTRPSTSAF